MQEQLRPFAANAEATAAGLGHRLGEWRNQNDWNLWAKSARCRNCAAQVDIDYSEATIEGRAVETRCKIRQRDLPWNRLRIVEEMPKPQKIGTGPWGYRPRRDTPKPKSKN